MWVMEQKISLSKHRSYSYSTHKPSREKQALVEWAGPGSSKTPFSSWLLSPSLYPIYGYFCFPVKSDFFLLASFLQGWEYTSVWELMPWFTAQLHEKQTEGPGCLLILLSSNALLPFAPDSVTLGSEHMGEDFLHSHLWTIYKIYCTFLAKCSLCEPHERSMDLQMEKNTPRPARKHWFQCHMLLLLFEWGVHKLNKCSDHFKINDFWRCLFRIIQFHSLCIRNNHFLFVWFWYFLFGWLVVCLLVWDPGIKHTQLQRLHNNNIFITTPQKSFSWGN